MIQTDIDVQKYALNDIVQNSKRNSSHEWLLIIHYYQLLLWHIMTYANDFPLMIPPLKVQQSPYMLGRRQEWKLHSPRRLGDLRHVLQHVGWTGRLESSPLPARTELTCLASLESHCPQASTGSLPKHAKSLIIFDPCYYPYCPLFCSHSCENKSVRFCPSIESIVPSSSI